MTPTRPGIRQAWGVRQRNERSGGVKSLLLGSCSHHVAQHARSPVLIVPDGEIADARRVAAQASGGATGSGHAA
jgi:hypothetical protein